jgi:L-ascorbate metabolism protein UlaG (beta-lactamase superfamily)
MAGIRCDVAFIPCCSDYTVDAEEAVRMAEMCGASVLVPLHWDDTPDGPREVQKMVGLFSGRVELLERTV